MKSFKEQLEKDLDSVFFNMNEFAETHMIDGKEVPIVLDNDRIIELSMGKTVETRGIFTDDILFFVQKKDLDYEPVAGRLHYYFNGEPGLIVQKIEVTGIEDVEKRLGNLKSKAPLVVARAINRATTNVKKNMAKETSGKYFVSSGDVKKTITVTKATKSSLKAAVISNGTGIALSKFKVSPGTPVRYRGKNRSPKVYKAGVEKAGGVKPLDGDPKSFIAIMKSGHKGVFTRTSGRSLPIKQLYGPSVPQMIKNEKIMKAINDDANETLQKRIDAEIANLLRKG